MQLATGLRVAVNLKAACCAQSMLQHVHVAKWRVQIATTAAMSPFDRGNSNRRMSACVHRVATSDGIEPSRGPITTIRSPRPLCRSRANLNWTYPTCPEATSASHPAEPPITSKSIIFGTKQTSVNGWKVTHTDPWSRPSKLHAASTVERILPRQLSAPESTRRRRDCAAMAHHLQLRRQHTSRSKPMYCSGN